MISERKQPVTVRSMSQSAGPLRFLNFESKAYKLLVNPAYTSINGSCTRICSIGPLKYGKKKIVLQYILQITALKYSLISYLPAYLRRQSDNCWDDVTPSR